MMDEAPNSFRIKIFQTREAGVSIKPGVERSGTPGHRWMSASPRSGRQRRRFVGLTSLSFAYGVRAVARFTGSGSYSVEPGVPLRSTPGFMLSPAPRARATRRIKHSLSERRQLKRRVWFKIVLLLTGLFALSSSGSHALNYRTSFMQERARITGPTTSGNVIIVNAGGNLQQALNQAQCGDTIVLDAGAAFLTSADQGFVFPAKRGGSCNGTAADTITVRTANPSGLPAAGHRVGINHARNMPKIVTPGPTPAISFAANSRFWKLSGVEVTTTATPQYVSFLVYLGTNMALSELPADVTFDRCYIHSQEDGTNNAHASSRGGIDVEALRVTFSGCRIAFPGGYAGASKSTDATYAILMVAGPRPLTIDNCFLNSSFSIFFMGGGNLWTTNTATVAPGATMTQARLSNTANLRPGDLIAFQTKPGYSEVAKITSVNGSTVSYKPWGGNIGRGLPLTAPPISPGGARWNGLNPGNVKITHSTFYINPAIAGQIASEIGYYPKNFFEIKSADKLYMEGNEFTGWPACLALTVRNQTGPNGAPSPWSTIRDVTFKNNRYANMSRPFGAQLFGLQLEDNIGTSMTGGNILIENNLFTTGGYIGDLIGGHGVTYRHNTIINNGAGRWAEGRMANGVYPVTALSIVDNIIFNNEYGMGCQAPYSQTWTTCWPNLQMTGNILITERMDPYRPNCANAYPGGNVCPATQAEVGFVDAPRGNYRLAANSAYKRKASDGSDPGVNMDQLEAALAKP